MIHTFRTLVRRVWKHHPRWVVSLAVLCWAIELLFPQLVVAQTIPPQAVEPAPATQSSIGAMVTSEGFPTVGSKPSRDSFEVLISAYSSTVDQTDSTPFITANGSTVHPGTIAANFLPFGTKVRLPAYFGDRVFVVEDRMNARYDFRMDIWMETHDAAVKWGVRRVKVEVL